MSQDTPSPLASPTITLSAERPALLKGLPTEMRVLLQVKAPDRPESDEVAQRPPVNIAVVLDRSGSMNGAPLEEAKRCARFVQERLTSDDLISLISYDDEVSVDAPAAPAHPNPLYQHAAERMVCGGSTNLFGGWERGVSELKKNSERFSLNRVFLLSDGRLNQGLRDPGEIAARVNAASEEGVSTSTYGLSPRFDESVMRLMAEEGGGQLRYGERVEDLFEAFEEELDLINALYASQLRLTIKPAPGVRVRCLNNFVERNGAWVLPDLAFGVEVWAGLSVSVSAEAVSAEGALFEVEVSHTDLQVSTQGSFERPVRVDAEVFSAVGVDPEVEAYFAELKVSSLKDEAAQASRRREWDRVKELIKQMRALPLNLQQREELNAFEELTERREAELVSKEAFTSSSRARRSMKGSREHYMSLMSPDEQATFMHRKIRHGRNKGDQS